MATSGSSLTPTPLGLEENVGVGQPSRANALQYHPTRFNSPNAEVRLCAITAALTKTFPVNRNRKDVEI
ncbi:hypothetical protein TNCV_370221 [Trichonephila clavipes]|nr:hypothetical protein TNCV_370221 [Trichonephila clavipes]